MFITTNATILCPNKDIHMSLHWPDCDKDPLVCFEKYLRTKIETMKEIGLCHMQIGEFDDSHDLVFKKLKQEIPEFNWNTRSKNIGTVKNKFVYKMDLYLKK